MAKASGRQARAWILNLQLAEGALLPQFAPDYAEIDKIIQMMRGEFFLDTKNCNEQGLVGEGYF